MTISVWRYSHLALAISSFLFILIASVTGVILAFEPVIQKTAPYRPANFNELTVGTAIKNVEDSFSEVNSITIDANEFTRVKGTNQQGKPVEVYVDPSTGKTLAPVQQQSAFFLWVTALHRSLFIHETGRFFIGLSSFLLMLIAVSGIALVVQRQRGFKRFFDRIVKENFYQYYHVVLGRLSLIPIFLIAITGTYLSLEEFNVFPTKKIVHTIEEAKLTESKRVAPANMPLFNQLKLAEVKIIEYPFSEFPEDYFLVKLNNREIAVNQYNGAILNEIPYPFTTILTNWNLDVHTGRTSVIWALVLAIASVNILFFIYSGFKITLQRISGRVKNKFKLAESRFIILVGSENGSTMRFAKAVHEQLIQAGQTSYIDVLNRYTFYPRAEHILVISSTYGLGDAPTNGNQFLSLLAKHPQQQAIHFSVVGFGSHAYPDYCKFAFEVHNNLSQQTWAKALMDVHTVNDKSLDEFNQWFQQWAQKQALPQLVLPKALQQMPADVKTIGVINKQLAANNDGLFLLTLQPKRLTKFTSGDLLAIYPAGDHRERLYSIAKIGKSIQLTIRLHEQGLGSGYLFGLQQGDLIKARIVNNKGFHFPTKASEIVMVANGTGIAPFLGMIAQNTSHKPCYLYAGFRQQTSFNLFEESLEQYKAAGKVKMISIGFSREAAQPKQYVTDMVARDVDAILQVLTRNGVLMLCGSLSMEKDMIALLQKICFDKTGKPFSHFQAQGQILSDCY